MVSRSGRSRDSLMGMLMDWHWEMPTGKRIRMETCLGLPTEKRLPTEKHSDLRLASRMETRLGIRIHLGWHWGTRWVTRLAKLKDSRWEIPMGKRMG